VAVLHTWVDNPEHADPTTGKNPERFSI
jgi:hypothetical protein